MKNYKIVIQARTGSSRLPSKMIKTFNKDKNLLQVIIENLLFDFNSNDIIIATTNNKNDNIIEKIAIEKGVGIFRGDENDVLSRFLEIAKLYKLDFVIRVCADNPFIQNSKILELIKYHDEDIDYESFFFSDGTPSILSHSGFFTELISTSALKKINLESKDILDKEHVTRFIYNNSNIFNIKKHPIENEDFVKKIRLTIDTKEDFTLCSEIFSKTSDHRIENLIKILSDENLDKMKEMIYKYKK